MPDFLDSVKKGVSAAVSRTSWEAQKQMRVRSKQTEVDKLLEQREKLLNDLAQTAIDLYQKGLLTDGHLSRVCASIQELDHDVQNREAQLTEIKKEMYPAQQLAPAQTADYTPPVPTYTPPTPATPTSATPAPAPRQPVAAPAANPPQVQSAICPSCGNPIRPNALYCRNCGAKLR
ncbi:MAG TPA: zinc ribbon domain-containing protein [Ktedonobacteraceae bacterium]